MTSFDLNEMPAYEDEVPAVEKEMVEDVHLPGPWQGLTPAELAALFNSIRIPPNYHRVHQVVTHRANGTSHYGWVSWLRPPHHASPGGAVIHSAEWINMPSIFEATPPLAAHALAIRAPERGVPVNVNSAFFDPRKRKSDVMDAGSSSVRLGELDTAEDVTKRGAPIIPLPSGSISQHLSAENDDVGENNAIEAGSTSQHLGAESDDESENITIEAEDIRGAELLEHLLKEERRKKRESDFLACFDFTTHRCNPTAPCSRCLQLFKAPLPVNLSESSGSRQGAFADDDPPVLKNMDAEEVAQKKGSRHGPKSKSSEYRGVTYYKRTGRWESHIWHEAAQVYLGASATKEDAAKAYDKAALMLHGPDVDINYEPKSYQDELNYLHKLNKEQLVIYLRRDSRGFRAQATYPGVKHIKNRYQAIYKKILWGTFPTEEQAARVVYKAAVADGCGKVASSVMDTHHVRSMPSFAAQHFAAVYPEEMGAQILKNQTKASKEGGKSSATKKSPSRTTKREPNSSFPTPSAAASPVLVEQLPAIDQINESVPSSAKRIRSNWGQHLASRKSHKQMSLATNGDARNPPATAVVPPAPSSRRACNTTSPGIGVSRIPPSSATVLSAFNGIGQTSTTSVPVCSVSSSPWKKRPMTSDTSSAPGKSIKFKLFNVEIHVAEKAAPGHGGHGGHGNSIPTRGLNLNGVEAGGDLDTPPLVTAVNRFDKLVLPQKRCKTRGERNPHLPQELATDMASGLNDVVGINNHLQQILSETVDPNQTIRQGPRTCLTREQPEVRQPRFPYRWRYWNPSCTCRRSFHEQN